jgi:hypothetical protein
MMNLLGVGCASGDASAALNFSNPPFILVFIYYIFAIQATGILLILGGNNTSHPHQKHAILMWNITTPALKRWESAFWPDACINPGKQSISAATPM